MTERRRWKRLRGELGVRLALDLDRPEGQRFVVARGSHLNPEGIFVVLANPPPVGSRVRVTLEAEGTEGLLTADGEVVDRVDIGGVQPPGVGIRLEEPGPAWSKLYDFLLTRSDAML